jgi:thioesterase domain-containing protein
MSPDLAPAVSSTKPIASAVRDREAPATRTEAFNPLVLLQSGRGLPFFCVHGAGGNVLNFRDIARRLGTDQTFYGLQAQGVEGSRPLESVEAMAELYLPHILRAHPQGPFLIGGYSGGGVVAYELAQQLVRAGHKVPLLVLLDTFRAGVRPMPTSMKEHLALLKKEGPAYVKRRAEDKFARFTGELSSVLKIKFYEAQQQALPLELREAQLSRSFMEAAARYQPKPYPGPVTLYRALFVSAPFKHAGAKLGWDDVIEDLTVVEVPGTHDTLVYEPNVSIMTSHLRGQLDRASGRG